MGTYILVLGIALFLATALVIVMYLRSSFILLDLVKQDEAIWRQLDCPQRLRISDGESTVLTIKPLFPWLDWVWLGDPRGVNQQTAERLATTSKLLRLSLAMFVGITLVVPPMLLLWA